MNAKRQNVYYVNLGGCQKLAPRIKNDLEWHDYTCSMLVTARFMVSCFKTDRFAYRNKLQHDLISLCLP